MDGYPVDLEKLFSVNPRLYGFPRVGQAALARILLQVGSEHVPADIDQSSLQRDLEVGFAYYRVLWFFRCSLSERHFRRAIEKLYAPLRQVSIALAAFENPAMCSELRMVGLGLRDPENDEVPSTFSELLERSEKASKESAHLHYLFDDLSYVVDACAEAIRRELKRPAESPSSQPRPEMYLIGQCLPEIFERHFGPFRLSRSASGSPGIRFVMACLEYDEVRSRSGQPYDPDTIIKYRQRALRSSKPVDSPPGFFH